MEPYRQSVAPEHGPRIAAIGGGTGLSTPAAWPEALYEEYHSHCHGGR